VDTVLNASDEILEVQSTPQWKTTVRIELNQHRDYLLSPHFQNSGFIKQYTPQFRAFIQDALKDQAQ
jgi:hypothetical protein